MASPPRRHDPDRSAGLPSADDPAALSWLLRRTVRQYRAPVAAALRQGGFHDLPQQGIWAVSVLAQPGTVVGAGDLIARMSITKQAVSQLVDTLVAAGYVERQPDGEDRRRTVLHLTTRGRRAARVINEAVAEVEASMAAKLGADQLKRLHTLLQELDGPDQPVG